MDKTSVFVRDCDAWRTPETDYESYDEQQIVRMFNPCIKLLRKAIRYAGTYGDRWQGPESQSIYLSEILS